MEADIPGSGRDPGRRRNWLMRLSSTAVGLLTMRGVRTRRRRRKHTPFASLSLAPSWCQDEGDEGFGPSISGREVFTDSSVSVFPLTLTVPPSWLGSSTKSASSHIHHHQHSHRRHRMLQLGQQQHVLNIEEDEEQFMHGEPHAAPHASVQRLVAAGSRMWGSGSWMDARNLLGVKIYDFAVYVDEAAWQQASGAPAATSSSGLGLMQPNPEQLVARVLRAPAPPCSLVLRAARDLPCQLLHTEMARVLERRYVKAGGQVGDPELQLLLSCFSAESLPASVRTANGSAVRRGSTMVFTRSEGGTLVATALEGSLAPRAWGAGQCAGAPMLPAPVHSPQLGEALMDLYLGDQPVSKRAKAAAAAALQRLAVPGQGGSGGVVYSPIEKQRLDCSGAESLDACVLQVQ